MVTGASRGIGRAIAEDLAANGARVAVNYHSNAEAATEVIAAIEASGGTAIAIQADVSRYDEANRLIVETIKQFGHIDILVNNAGTTRYLLDDDDRRSMGHSASTPISKACLTVVKQLCARWCAANKVAVSSTSHPLSG